MKIKVEITLDNGSVDCFMLEGKPEPESIMKLVNKLKSLYDTAVAGQSLQGLDQHNTQPTVITPKQVQPQVHSQVQPQVQPQVHSQVQPQVQPQVQSQVQPHVQPQVQSQVQPHVQPQVHSQVQPQVEPLIYPQIQPVYTKQYVNQPPQDRQKNIGGTHNLRIAEEEYSRLKNESLTIKQRLELFLNFEYKDQWFTSLEVKRDYDRIYGNINLSTVSTYLSRMYRENKLERMGNRNQRKYHIREEHKPQEYSFGAVPSFGIST